MVISERLHVVGVIDPSRLINGLASGETMAIPDEPERRRRAAAVKQMLEVRQRQRQARKGGPEAALEPGEPDGEAGDQELSEQPPSSSEEPPST
jgi:hypothetical protein